MEMTDAIQFLYKRALRIRGVNSDDYGEGDESGSYFNYEGLANKNEEEEIGSGEHGIQKHIPLWSVTQEKIAESEYEY